MKFRPDLEYNFILIVFQIYRRRCSQSQQRGTRRQNRKTRHFRAKNCLAGCVSEVRLCEHVSVSRCRFGIEPGLVFRSIRPLPPSLPESDWASRTRIGSSSAGWSTRQGCGCGGSSNGAGRRWVPTGSWRPRTTGEETSVVVCLICSEKHGEKSQRTAQPRENVQNNFAVHTKLTLPIKIQF